MFWLCAKPILMIGARKMYKYRVIQEDRSILWEVIVLVIVRKKVHMNMCLILNGYWARAVWIYKYKSIVNGTKERQIM
jgi:hypothetical protein